MYLFISLFTVGIYIYPTPQVGSGWITTNKNTNEELKQQLNPLKLKSHKTAI